MLKRPDIRLPVLNKPESSPARPGSKLLGTPVFKKPELKPLLREPPLAVLKKPEIKPFSTRSSSPSVVMIRMCRSWTRIKTLVPA